MCIFCIYMFIMCKKQRHPHAPTFPCVEPQICLSNLRYCHLSSPNTTRYMVNHININVNHILYQIWHLDYLIHSIPNVQTKIGLYNHDEKLYLKGKKWKPQIHSTSTLLKNEPFMGRSVLTETLSRMSTLWSLNLLSGNCV